MRWTWGELRGWWSVAEVSLNTLDSHWMPPLYLIDQKHGQTLYINLAYMEEENTHNKYYGLSQKCIHMRITFPK